MFVETIILEKDGDKIRVNVGDEARFQKDGYKPIKAKPEPEKAQKKKG